LGAKRLVVVLPKTRQAGLSATWIEEVGNRATLVWQ
jgi:hypothetical protein